MDIDRIPDELKQRRQWVCWSLVDRDDKPTKLPFSPLTGNIASATNPDTWATFDEAINASANYNGVGFVFSADDDYFGLDLDGHIDHDLIRWFGTYAERSQSGKGCHIIGRGKIPGGKGRRVNGYELYDHARYFVMTGDALNSEPITDCQIRLEEFIEQVFPQPKGADLTGLLGPSVGSPGKALYSADHDVLERIRSSVQAGKFERLWNGVIGEYGNNHSVADAALMAILHFWTGGDRDQAERLFGQSALAARSKWTNRPDYRDKTWALVQGNEVYERPEPLPVHSPIVQIKKANPWRQVTIEHAGEAISGTILNPIVRAICSPCDPPLPLEVGLIKSLVLAGAALTTKRTQARGLGGLIARGHVWANLRILTAGGQVCNFWGLIIGGSASGKDVGRVMETTAIHNKWLIGTAGSEEGIADAYMAIPNGIMSISEMMNWLDNRHWQSKASSFLTGAFNAGWFAHAMSARSQSPVRETNYCYPNIYASVQPGILQDFASKSSLDSGFLGRFLVAKMPDGYFGYPLNVSLDDAYRHVLEQCRCLKAKAGDVIVPHRYNHHLVDLFMGAGATPDPSWRRLVNEYYPRIALLCSIAPGDDNPEVTITQDGWRKADVLVKYFFAQAEAAFSNLHFDPQISRFENLCQRILDIVSNSPQRRCTKHEISQRVGKGSKVKDRDAAIGELVERGLIIRESAGGTTWLATAGT